MKIGDKVSLLDGQLQGTIIGQANLSKMLGVKDMYWEVGRIACSDIGIIFGKIYVKEESLIKL